ncbi:MAG: hypothetical protein WA902_07790 [Thermosynechococcaceae cyanobacterium]
MNIAKREAQIIKIESQSRYPQINEALHSLMGTVLSVSAIHRMTVQAQQYMDAHRNGAITNSAPILMVDGVWVSNKADEIGAFPNEESCLTLFFLVLQRDHAKHNRFNNHGE